MPSAPQAPAVPTGQELSKEMDAWEAVKVGEVNPEGATKGETETCALFLLYICIA